MIRNKLEQTTNRSGSASIFVVIFTMLIISTVVVGFTAIMLRDQTQATNADLSKSAYDSAMAGVEDAKRSVLRYLNSCSSNPLTPTCIDMKSDFEKCNSNSVILYGLGRDNMTERVIRTTSSLGDAELNQAYTCVKTTLDTPNYIGKIDDGEQALVLLRGAANFNSVRISWFSYKDVQEANESLNVTPRTKVNNPTNNNLPYNTSTAWPANRPPQIRAQYVQVPSSFSLSDFDFDTPDGKSNVNTIFMHPFRGAGSGTIDLASEAPRFNSSADPALVSCVSAVTSADGYACSATLTLPQVIGSGNKAAAFLILRPSYNSASYKVELIDSAGGASTVVNFSGVQPKVDSTGRANNIFRRVEARIEPIDASNLAPIGAVETSNNFCKTFSVTDDVDGFQSGNCDPAKSGD